MLPLKLICVQSVVADEWFCVHTNLAHWLGYFSLFSLLLIPWKMKIPGWWCWRPKSRYEVFLMRECGNGGKIIEESSAVTNVFVFLIRDKDNFCVYVRLIELMEKSCVSNDHCNEIMLLMRTRTVNREKARWRTEIVEYCRKDEFCSVVFLCKWRCLHLRNDFVRISDALWVVSRAKNVGRLSWIFLLFSRLLNGGKMWIGKRTILWK